MRPEDDLDAFWELLPARQPHSQSYLDRPMTMTTDFYHMRLVITITPTEIVERLERRQRARPAIPWADYRAIRSRVRGGA